MSIARFRRFAWLVLGITLGVVVFGAYVRASGAGAGCGSHWPTCNGEVIPRPKTVETVIEFVHRATSGVITLLVAAELAWAFRLFPKGHRVRRAALSSIAFLVGEALIGAQLVLHELVTTNASIARAGWMSIHLVNTFLLLGSLALTAWFADELAPVRFRVQRGVSSLLLFGLAATAVVATTGALAALGDTLFPSQSLAEGLTSDLAPAAHLLLRVRVFHPIVAMIAGGYLVIAAAAVGARAPRLRFLSNRVSRLVLVQLGFGALNLGLLAPVWTQLLHLLLADLVWIALVVLTAASFDLSGAREVAGEPVATAA